MFTDLAQCRNEYRVPALEELAKHFEHKERNYGMALEFTLNAIECGDTPALRQRRSRLETRVAKRAANGRLL
jgi:hypothetical protein